MIVHVLLSDADMMHSCLRVRVPVLTLYVFLCLYNKLTFFYLLSSINSGKVASTSLISSTVGGLAGVYMQRQSTDVLLDAAKHTWMTAAATVSVQLTAVTAGHKTVTNILVQVCILDNITHMNSIQITTKQNRMYAVANRYFHYGTKGVYIQHNAVYHAHVAVTTATCLYKHNRMIAAAMQKLTLTCYNITDVPFLFPETLYIIQGFSPFDAFKAPGSVFEHAIADHGVHAQSHVVRPYVSATRAWRHDNEITSTSNPAIVSFNCMDYTLRTSSYYCNAVL
jgi:hypothetical protein